MNLTFIFCSLFLILARFGLSGREARHCAVCNGEDHEQSSEGVHSVYSVLQWTEERSEGLLLRLCHHLQEWQATN